MHNTGKERLLLVYHTFVTCKPPRQPHTQVWERIPKVVIHPIRFHCPTGDLAFNLAADRLFRFFAQ